MFFLTPNQLILHFESGSIIPVLSSNLLCLFPQLSVFFRQRLSRALVCGYARAVPLQDGEEVLDVLRRVKNLRRRHGVIRASADSFEDRLYSQRDVSCSSFVWWNSSLYLLQVVSNRPSLGFGIMQEVAVTNLGTLDYATSIVDGYCLGVPTRFSSMVTLLTYCLPDMTDFSKNMSEFLNVIFSSYSSRCMKKHIYPMPKSIAGWRRKMMKHLPNECLPPRSSSWITTTSQFQPNNNT